MFKHRAHVGRGIDDFEVVFLRQALELRQQLGLILPEAVVHILAGMNIHAGFPIIEPPRENHAGDQIIHANAQIEGGVRLQRKAIDVANPPGVSAPHDGARHQGIDIAIGQHHETGPQRRNDFMFQAVGEIRGIEQAQGNAPQGVPFFCLLDALAGKFRALDGGVENRPALLLEPRPQQPDLG